MLQIFAAPSKSGLSPPKIVLLKNVNQKEIEQFYMILELLPKSSQNLCQIFAWEDLRMHDTQDNWLIPRLVLFLYGDGMPHSLGLDRQYRWCWFSLGGSPVAVRKHI